MLQFRLFINAQQVEPRHTCNSHFVTISHIANKIIVSCLFTTSTYVNVIKYVKLWACPVQSLRSYLQCREIIRNPSQLQSDEYFIANKFLTQLINFSVVYVLICKWRAYALSGNTHQKQIIVNLFHIQFTFSHIALSGRVAPRAVQPPSSTWKTRNSQRTWVLKWKISTRRFLFHAYTK